jgi:hypothetical protein
MGWRAHARRGAAVLALVAAGGAPDIAAAALYRCPPAAGPGSSVITNLVDADEARQLGCEALHSRMSMLDEGVPTAPLSPHGTPTRRGSVAPAPPSASKSGRQTVSAREQQARDEDRRQILGDELRTSTQAVDRLQHAVAASAASPDERRRLQDELARNLSDVDALKREIALLPEASR